MAAARHESGDHMVTDEEIGDTGSECFDPTGTFVAEHHGQRSRSVAVDHREIGVAEPRRTDAQQHLPGARRREFELHDLERTGFGIGCRDSHPGEQGGAHLHAVTLSPAGCSGNCAHEG